MSKITVLLLAAFIAHAWADAPPEVGAIQEVDPAGTQVSVKNAQGATEEKPAGAPLLQSDQVIAKPNQTVVLHLKDDSNITATPGTEISVKDYVPAQAGSVPHVELTKGSAHFDVNKTPTGHPTFFIRTKSATMGVRGTSFVVDQQSDGYSTVHTLQGNVAIAKNEADLEDHSKSVAVPAEERVFFIRPWLIHQHQGSLTARPTSPSLGRRILR